MFTKLKITRFVFILLVFLYAVDLAQAGDEKQINDALKKGNVQLEAKTYTLTDSIILQSDRTLEGQPGTVLKLVDRAGWEAWKPLIKGTGVQNVVIKNIEFNGNSDNNQDVGRKTHNGKAWGNGYYNFIHVVDSDSIIVENCIMYDGLGDGLRAKTSTNIIFRDNHIWRMGHEGAFFIDSKNIKAYNNRITTRTSNALRVWNCAHVRLYDNVLDSDLSLQSLAGMGGFQVEDSKGTLSDVEICNNIIFNTWGPAIWLIAYEEGSSNSQDVSIHHNLISQPGHSYNIPYTAGITINGQKGAIIQNNVFDSSYNAGVLVLSGGSGSLIQDNIFTNTREHAAINQAGSGHGVVNRASSSFSVFSNCFFENENGNLYKSSSYGDDLDNPKTHITSSGWIWTGKTWTCDRVKPLDLGAIKPAKPGKVPTIDHDISPLDSIFDILDVEFTASGKTGQKAEDIPLLITDETNGLIAGGVKIVITDIINIDGVPYIPGKEAIQVQTRAIRNPDLNFWTGIIKQVDKNVTIELKDGRAYAVMEVKTHWYTVKTDPITGKSKKSKIKTSKAVFRDSCAAPEILQRPTQAKGILYEYPINSLAYVPYNGLTSVEYEYDGKTVKHIYMIGEQHKNENGVIYTNFSKVNYWKGDLPHQGEFLFINGSFDPDKLTVTAYTPYESFQVIHFDHIKKEYPDKFYADWLLPSFGLFVILGFGAWYYIKKILY